MDKYKTLLFVVIITTAIGTGVVVRLNSNEQVIPPVTVSPTPAALSAKSGISYNGKNGIDALTLLKEQAEVELDNVGMVSAVNGTKADPTKREFWAFYVNGKMAEVGSADYKTVDSDVINWKIEKY